MRIATLLSASLSIALAAACKEPPREFAVGEHRVRLAVPSGWQALSQGRQLVIRKEELEVELSDLGAVRPDALRREVLHARDLWRNGQENAARLRLREFPLREKLYTTRKQYDRILAAWQKVDGVALDNPPAAVETPFRELLAVIDSTPQPALEAIVDDVLPRLGHDERRYEVKSRTPTTVDGREAMTVETWLSLSHTGLQRQIIVVNEGRVLALQCRRCSDPVAAGAFEAVAASLHFAPGSRK